MVDLNLTKFPSREVVSNPNLEFALYYRSDEDRSKWALCAVFPRSAKYFDTAEFPYTQQAFLARTLEKNANKHGYATVAYSEDSDGDWPEYLAHDFVSKAFREELVGRFGLTDY